MPKLTLKIYVILSLILIFFIVTFLVLSSRNQKKQEVLTPSPTPEPITDFFPSPVISPEIIEATETGGLEGGTDPAVKREGEQIQDLSYKVPLSEPLFDMDFDWKEYKFVVNLKEPKDQARVSFEQWIQTNYPAITDEYLIVN